MIVSVIVRRAGVTMQAADEVRESVAPSRDAAISALFLAEAPRLLAIGELLVGDRSVAEDLVQDAFVTLYRRWLWLRDREAAASYLMGAVIRGARLTLRQRYAARDAVRRMELERHQQPPSPETAALMGEERAAVTRALQTLSLRQRQVIVLRYYAGRSESEIADTLGISRGSVKRHASRGLASLTHLLEASS